MSLLGRSKKPDMGIMDNCLLQPHHLLQANPRFEEKTTSFVAILAKNTCVYGCRLLQ